MEYDDIKGKLTKYIKKNKTNQEAYELYPFYMIPSNDIYFLIGYNDSAEKGREIYTMRLDHIEKIETIDPDHFKEVITPEASDVSNTNAPINDDDQEEPIRQMPNISSELSYLQMENEELKIRIKLLNKTLLGIVEAIATL